MPASTGSPLLLPRHPSVPTAELSALQRAVTRSMLQLNDDRFPGSQPVSFRRQHLQSATSAASHACILSKPYYAAEKTNGVRYMLLILDGRTYAVDRNFGMKELPMHFPSREPGRLLERTLLDGELVIDKDAVDGTLRHRFLVYDACCVDGRNLLSEPLPTRLMVMRREVLAPRFAAARAGDGGADFEGEPFVIEQKDFFALPQLPAIFGQVCVGASLHRARHGPSPVVTAGSGGHCSKDSAQ